METEQVGRSEEGQGVVPLVEDQSWRLEDPRGPLGITGRLRGKNVLSDADLSPQAIAELLQTAARLKGQRARREPHTYLAGRTLGLVFQHPSTRTRTAFQVGMEQLGGQAIFLGVNDMQLKRGETIGDTAQILSRYVDAIAMRIANHDELLEFAEHATVPVFNALTSKCHPIEPLGDLLTLQERFGHLDGLKFAYLGDGNNVCHSLLMSCAATGVSISVGSPPAYQPEPDVVSQAQRVASTTGATITITDDAMAAAKDADAVYTDVHQSMGEADDSLKATRLAPYRVTKEVMGQAKETAVFMHCLPMRRGEEVDAEVADGPQSIVFDQAENRLHIHKALLLQTLW